MTYTNTPVITSTTGLWSNANGISFSSINTIPNIPFNAQLEVERVFSSDRDGSTSVITNFLTDLNVKQSDKRELFLVPNSRLTINNQTKTITAINLPSTGNDVYNFVYYKTNAPNVQETIKVPTVADNSNITIRRKTVSNIPLISWVPGSKLTSSQLNLQTTQFLYLAQELLDRVFILTTTNYSLVFNLANNTVNTLQIVDGAVTPSKISTANTPWSFNGTVSVLAPTADANATTRLYSLNRLFEHGVMTKDDSAPSSSAIDILETAPTAGASGLWFNPKSGQLSAWAGNAWVAVAGTPVTTANLVSTNTVQTLTAAKTFAAGTVVPFTQTGTGAVARTVGAKLNEFISVKDFGAVGDGVADDTAAIQNAVNASTQVYFPAGIYKCDGIVTLDANSNLFGAGRGATRIVRNGLNSPSVGVLYAQSASSTTFIDNITIRDMTLDGQVATLGFSEFRHLVSLNGVRNVVIECVDFVGFRGDGLLIGSGILAGTERHNVNVVVRNCLFDGINKDNRNGISVIDVDGLVVDSCSFRRTTRSNMPGAIDVEPDGNIFTVVRDIKIINNTFDDIGGNVAAIAFLLPAADAYTAPYHSFIVSGNVIKTCAADGIVYRPAISGGVTEGMHDQALCIKNNVVTDVSRSINVTNCKAGIVSDNMFVRSSSSSLIGYSTANDNIIDMNVSGNMFIQCGSAGIGDGLNIFSCSRLRLEDNTFKDCGTGVAGDSDAISFNTGTSQYVSIVGNTFASPGGKTLVAIQKEALHTFTPATNTYLGNTIVGALGNSFEAETSDSLETGWSPIVEGAGIPGTGTYSLQFGRYRKVGRMVFFRLKVSVNAGHTGTGGIEVSLPTVVAPQTNNEETMVTAVVTGVSSTGGHAGFINPAATVGSVGCVRLLQTQTGTVTLVNIPAGDFTVYTSGYYQSA